MTPLDNFFHGCKVFTMYAAGVIGVALFFISVLFLGSPLGFALTLFGLGCVWFASSLSKTLTEEINKILRS